MDRKEFLKGMGMASLSTIILLDGCNKDSVNPGSSSSSSSSSSNSSSSSSSSDSTCALTNSETDGPYPLYTSRGSSIQRVDITEDGAKTGLPLSITITIQNKNNSCAPLEGVLVDIWHCDKDGYYSGYAGQPGYLGTKDYTGSTWLRGRQTTDSNGQVKFTSIYPGWYTGRMTHIHVQIYTAANSSNGEGGNNSVLTTQIAFPDDITQAVYKTSLYSAHGQNTITFASDNVFSDGYTNELCTLIGDTTNGYALTHTINVSA